MNRRERIKTDSPSIPNHDSREQSRSSSRALKSKVEAEDNQTRELALRLPERLVVFGIDLGAAHADVVQDVVRHLVEMVAGPPALRPFGDPVEQADQAFTDIGIATRATQIADDLCHDFLTSHWDRTGSGRCP